MAKFEFKGLDELIRKMEKLPEAVANAALTGALQGALGPMAAAARREAPVDTGATRDHVEITPSKRKRGWAFSNVRVSAGDFYEDGGFYPAFVVYGHERGGVLHPPNNFLKRAFDATHEEVQGRAAAAITAAVERAWDA